MLRVLVTGDRNYTCPELARAILTKLIAKHGVNVVIVHGCGTGVDASFSNAARCLGLDVEPHYADWKDGGKSAGPKRNQEMVDAGADFCIAVHDAIAWSKGTKDCVARCLMAKIPVFLFSERDTTYIRLEEKHLNRERRKETLRDRRETEDSSDE